MGFIAGDSVLDAAYGYGMVCDVIRNPDETYPVICRFWQNGRPVEISYTRDGFNDVSDMIPSLVHAGTGAAKGKCACPLRISTRNTGNCSAAPGRRNLERMLQSTALHEMMKRMPFRFIGRAFLWTCRWLGKGRGLSWGAAGY